MSGGKKKRPKARTYSEGEVRRMIRNAADDAVKRNMLISVVTARDMFDLDEDGVVEFMGMMQRYIKYLSENVVDLKDFTETLSKKTGIDLRLSRW